MGLTKEERVVQAAVRRRAIEMCVAGVPANDVADTLRVDRSSVFRWKKEYAAGGLAALKPTTAAGPATKLTGSQIGELRALIVGADPRQFGFAFALWTRDLVAELIEVRFGVVMSASAVGRMLRREGLSPQRPLWRAYQADPAKVERWKTEEFPAIAAEAKAAGGLVFFGDEAAMRSDYHGGTTWGEVGHTPVVATTGARHRVNMISAVSPQGKLHFRLVEGIVDADAFIAYCGALAADYAGRPVYLIIDGHPAHRAKATKEWVAAQKGRIKLFYLPGYSPQLNPDEWVWKNVKHDRVGRAGITSLDDLRRKAVTALQRIADTPALIKGFFGDPDLSYIQL
jgi:transposase